MMEITTQAERELWENPLNINARIEPMNLRDYDANLVHFKKFLLQFQSQNEVLRFIAQEILVNPDANNKAPGGVGVGAANAERDWRMTARNIVQFVIHPLRLLLMPENEGSTHGGMFRRHNNEICALGPQMDDSYLGTAKYLFWTKVSGIPAITNPFRHHHHDAIDAASLPALPKIMGEPTQLNKNEWVRQLQRAMGQD